jgi:hypothetical protein
MDIFFPGIMIWFTMEQKKRESFSLLRSQQPPLIPLFQRGNKLGSSSSPEEKALLPLKKGGREGFLEKPFSNHQTDKIIEEG